MNNRSFLWIFTGLVLAVSIALAGDADGISIVSGLNGPMGLLVDDHGDLWIVEAGIGGEDDIAFVSDGSIQPVPAKMGNSARILRAGPNGEVTEIAALPSVVTGGIEVLGGARLALLDGVLYVTSGQWHEGNGPNRREMMAAVIRVEGERLTEVANTWAFEAANNPDGYVIDSHPYGLAAGPDDWLWVTDAGANDLLRVNPDTGEIVAVTAFGGLPGAFPNSLRGDAIEADPVPTGIAFDAEGNAYVSLLSGVPFIPGSAKVLRVSEDGEVSDYATGLTMLTDLKLGPDGELYAIQFGMFTQEGPVMNAGAVLRIKPGSDSEIVVDGLAFPTAIAFDAEGNAYVNINAVGEPGSGEVLRFDGLTARAGKPITLSQ